MATGISDIAIIILCATGLALAAKLLRQPLILAYLITGILVGYLNLFNLESGNMFQVFSDLGIMFLLFLIGLEINYTTLRMVGKTSLIVGLGQIALTTLLGFFFATLFNFPTLQAVYISVALTFSSTIVALKLLSEKRDEHSLYGKISIGMLLVQDIVVILVLVLLAGVQTDGVVSLSHIAFTLIKGIFLFGLMMWLGRKILPAIFDRAARSQELLFLMSLAWVFLVVASVKEFGFSIEIGGFLAGIALANSSENFQITGRLKPLRDFFILIFFVILGSSMVFSGFGKFTLPIIAFSLFVLIIKPLIVFALMGFLGYRKRTSFLTGITIAQVSEFSLVAVVLGERLGYIPKEVVALITVVGIITITGSAYLIEYAKNVFAYFKPFLYVFERKKLKELDMVDGASRPIILIGCHRTGESIALHLNKKNLLIIDFDPDVIKELKLHGFHYVFGDSSDPEILELAGCRDARLVISTSPDIEDNLSLISYLKSFSRPPKIVVRAETERDARTLYDAGAQYVILPHLTAGQYFGSAIADDMDFKVLKKLREFDETVIRSELKRIA